MTARERTLEILLRIITNPYQFTRRQLAQHFGKSKDAIDDDIKTIRAVGLDVEQDQLYRLAILPSNEFRELQHLQPLSESDKAQIKRALDFLSSKDKLYLSKKIESLYDFQQMGIRALRKPALERLDRLQKAKREKKRVVLENYYSRSNIIRDRLVEPFHIDTETETVQAYDIEQRQSRHYRLSRIERVVLTDEAWNYENDHRQKVTDVFRIAENDQVNVHLQMNVFAYNSLIEEFPLTRTYLEPGAEPNTFDFQCQVNKDFKGIVNFIMANAGHVTILSPKGLKQQILEEARKIVKKLQE